MMSEDELAAIERRAAAATAGEWRVARTARRDWWVTVPDDSDHDFREAREPIFESSGTSEQFGRDAAFIAAAREDIPALVAEVRRLQEKNNRLTDALVGFCLAAEIEMADYLVTSPSGQEREMADVFRDEVERAHDVLGEKS